MTPEQRARAVLSATEAVLTAQYAQQIPHHWGTVARWQDGGPDPLDGVSAYWHPKGHWHYVASGMTERDMKMTSNPDVSGWGFEFSFRLEAPPAAVDLGGPPIWPLVLLQDLGRYVWETERRLAHGHFLRLEKRIPEFLALIEDPVLGRVDTVNGRFSYLQVVALNEAQFERFRGDDFADVIAELKAADPMLVSAVPFALEQKRGSLSGSGRG